MHPRSYDRRPRRPTDRRRPRAHIHAAARPAALSQGMTGAEIVRLALVVLADPGVRERLLEIFIQAVKGGPR